MIKNRFRCSNFGLIIECVNFNQQNFASTVLNRFFHINRLNYLNKIESTFSYLS